jgi:threonine/homoserine/homoserine lactone efflux protein
MNLVFATLMAGVAMGFFAGFTPGPLSTLVITQTLRYGYREGIKVSAAPLITDLPIIGVCLFALDRFGDFSPAMAVLSFAGAVYLLTLSYKSLRYHEGQLPISETRPESIRQGVLINFLNPHPYIFWVTVGLPYLILAKEEGRAAVFLFFLAFYVFLVGSKLLLALLTGKARAFLTGKGYLYVMRCMSLLLAFFAIMLIKTGLECWLKTV